MTHLEDGTLRAYLDEELDSDLQLGTTTHLSSCEVCATRLERIEAVGALVGRRLAVLDAPPPVATAWPAIERRIAQGATRRPISSLARAAGLVLLLGGGAAAALLPGSPLRRAEVADAPEAPIAVPAAALESTQAGIRPSAALDRVRFVVDAPAGTEVVVELVPAASGIFADSGSSFSSAGEEIRAVVSGGPIRVEMSTQILDAQLEINGRALVGVQSGRVVRAPADAERSSNPIRIRFLVP